MSEGHKRLLKSCVVILGWLFLASLVIALLLLWKGGQV
jgi:hypothetical protein